MASKLSLWNSTDGDSESQHLLGGIQRGGGDRKPPASDVEEGGASRRRYGPDRLKAVAQTMTAYFREVVAHEQRRSEIWGEVPEYNRHHEDNANVVSLLTYHWVGKYIFVAANEQLSNDTLSPPTQPNRSWESGIRLADEVQQQMNERHRWDPFLGCLVRLRKEALKSRGCASRSETDAPLELTGVLKWVGREWRAKSAPLLVGVEWEATPDWKGARSHSGIVDGETRFEVSQDNTATCEPAEDIEILLPEGDEMATLLSCVTDETTRAILQSGDGLLPRSKSTSKDVGRRGDAYRRGSSLATARTTASSTLVELAAVPPRTPSALRAMVRVHKWILLAQIPFKLVADYTNLSFPLILEYLVDFLDNPSPQWNVGMGLLAVIFVFNCITTLASQKFYHMSIRSGLVVRGSFLGYIYEKCFSISQKALAHPEMSTGRIVNMVSTDVERANDFCWYAMYLWASPQQLLIAVGLLYRLVGWCAVAGLGAMLFTMPIQGWVAKQQQKLRLALSKVTDQRVKVTSEFFGGIRIIKYMAWEPDFLERIQEFRRQELTLLKRIQWYRVLTSLLNVAAPTIVIATVLVLYHVTGHRLTARVVFPTIALLNLMRMPFMTIPFIFTALIQLLVAMTRVSRFMECENENIGQVQDIRAAEKLLPKLCDAACALEAVSLAAYTPSKLPPLLGGLSQAEATHLVAMIGRIRSRCACLSCRSSAPAAPASGASPTKPAATEEHFELTQKLLLRDVTVRIPKQKLTVVIGPTGCGKSTLLEAFLGQFDVVSGQIFAPRDAIAYVPQQPWIMNATLRNNILFFSPLDEAKFERALEACQLRSDLLTFPNGVDTEIGEKGVNLSGGQRARVSLARALYAEREVYLLDDPLSALDPHVSERIVDECICCALRGTTRVLCTHQTQVLSKADFIVALGSDGNIAFQGSYDAFLAAQPELSMLQRQLTSPMMTATMSASPLAKGTSGVGFHDVHVQAQGSGERAASGAVPAANFAKGGMKAEETAAAEGAHPTAAEAVSSESDTDEVDDLLLDPDELNGGAASGEAKTTAAQSAAVTGGAAGAVTSAATTVAAPNNPTSGNNGKLMTDEEKAVGSVPWRTYWRYFDACGGASVVVLVLLIYAVTEVFSVSSSVWLSIWSVQSYGLSQSTYLYVFLGCVALSTFSTPWRFYIAYNAMRQASLNMHQQVLHSVASAPMSFFDTTPLGRILNRFARDMDMCDNDLQMSYIMALSTIFSALSTSGVMLASQPYTLIAIVPCTVVYYRLMLFYNRANREIRRVSSIAKSPMFALLTEALTGYRSIRAYGKCHVMMTQAIRRLDIIFSASYLQNVANRWLGVRIEFLANCIITTIAGLAIFGKLLSFGSTNVGLLSLGFTMALSITQVLNWIVRQVAAVEADMNSVERLAYYTDNIDHEDIPELTDAISRRLRDLAPTTRTRATQFPEPAHDGIVDDGAMITAVSSAASLAAGTSSVVVAVPGDVVIAFKDVAMRYRPGLPLVLNHLSFEICQGEKVGVVGRTGSGKSSLLLTFLRIVDICDGVIEVLQRPIGSYGVHQLRRWYSMIPQDPLLFDGTVRSNLDPFHDSTDDDVKKALQYVGMKERIDQEPLGIRSPVLENGSNFSVGQRQLLCLARALLRKGARFVLMDEATANIDHALDRRIQATIKTAFANHTVITIAHRLHTIIEYERILVMDKGRVVENGAPWVLAKDPNSALRSMMRALGPEAEGKLLRLVERSRRAHEAKRK